MTIGALTESGARSAASLLGNWLRTSSRRNCGAFTLSGLSPSIALNFVSRLSMIKSIGLLISTICYMVVLSLLEKGGITMDTVYFWGIVLTMLISNISTAITFQ
jgi:hypothetical protein